jgi:hypothetical protein
LRYQYTQKIPKILKKPKNPQESQFFSAAKVAKLFGTTPKKSENFTNIPKKSLEIIEIPSVILIIPS